jgi:hypothetical protein
MLLQEHFLCVLFIKGEIMRLKSVKSQAELGDFSEIITLQVMDGNTEAVIVKYKDKELRIAVADSYSNNLKLSMEEPKEEVIKYYVTGSVKGVKINDSDLFETKAEAEDCKYDTMTTFGINKWDSDYNSLEVKETVILVDAVKI